MYNKERAAPNAAVSIRRHTPRRRHVGPGLLLRRSTGCAEQGAPPRRLAVASSLGAPCRNVQQGRREGATRRRKARCVHDSVCFDLFKRAVAPVQASIVAVSFWPRPTRWGSPLATAALRSVPIACRASSLARRCPTARNGFVSKGAAAAPAPPAAVSAANRFRSCTSTRSSRQVPRLLPVAEGPCAPPGASFEAASAAASAAAQAASHG